MLGFELNIKGEKISAALESGVVSIIATQLSKGEVNSIELDFGGLDSSASTSPERIKWYHSELAEGDEFTVTVRDITSSSAPLSRKKHESDIDSKLKSYHLLKKELEDKGLI